MEEWKEYKFSDFVEINPTVSLSGKEMYSFVEMKDLEDGNKFCFPSTERMPVSGARFQNGDTLFAKITPCLENGKICQVRGLKNGIGFGSTEFFVFRRKENVSNNDFVFYLSRWDEVRSFAESRFEGTSGRQRVPKNCFENLKLNLPPLPTQTAIAEIPSSLDDKIDLLHRQNKTLEELAETLFRNESEKWKTKSEKLISFGELIKPKRGKNITKENAIEGEFPVVAGGLEPSCYHNESNTLDTVITISSSGANAGFVRLYQTPVWASDCSYIDKSVTPFVYFSYVFLKVNQQLLFDKQEGSAQPHVYPSHVMELEISDFPENLIAEFEEQVSPFFQKVKSNSRQIRTLTRLRDTLLPKLMNGEIRVSEK